MKQTCGNCANGQWSLTPTGRIRAKTHGTCGKLGELIAICTHDANDGLIPCIKVERPSGTVIWPDYSAKYCPLYESPK